MVMSEKADKAASRIQAVHRGNTVRKLVEDQKTAGALPGQQVVKTRNPLSLDAGSDSEWDAEENDARPSGGALPYCGVACIPCVGLMAMNEIGKIDEQWEEGSTVQALNSAKRANHFGFIAVVFGTMIWAVLYGLWIKPLIAGEDPCENYPDCVPDEWIRFTLEGRPPE
jgi:hypothetical protein